MGIPTKAAAVANAFFDIQEADNTRFPLIDPMKLQKLLYYAHAWWLAGTDEGLFPEDIEAWPWGPVVRDIYTQFSDFGHEPIFGRRATELARTDDGSLNYRIREPVPVPDNVGNFLRRVWETHKSRTSIQLSNATHRPGEPWAIVKEQYGSLESKPRIPNELIRDVFKAKLAA